MARFPEAFLEALRLATPMHELVGRKVQLQRHGQKWVGLCPFHGEKTPSFHVYAGEYPHYHCFGGGCGEHGDAVSFVMRTEGLGFREAVERLAAEAGMEVPQPEGAAAQVEDRRSAILRLLAAAVTDYQSRLWSAEGAKALAYLRGRGLTDDTIKGWGLGWSGSARAIERDLGVNLASLNDAGLARVGEGGEPAGALFFDRVMFPIRDRAGRVIGFSGRRVDDGKPKYLNGPETAVFSKRRVLYGLDMARPAVQRGDVMVAVEGALDVIQSHQAGFAGAVGTLGTALTVDHLAEMWRVSPCPVLCTDGDAAGLRAARKAIETALPLVTPEQGVRVATLLAGDDPDALIRRDGAEAWGTVLRGAASLVDVLCAALRDEADLSSPEGRAALAERLDAAAAKVRHRALSWQYRMELRSRFNSRSAVIARVDRAVPGQDAITSENARILTAAILHHPQILPRVEHAYLTMDLPAPWGSLQAAIIERIEADDLVAGLRACGLGGFVSQALADFPAPLPAFARRDAALEEVEGGWWQVHALMGRPTLDEQIEQATADFAADPSVATQDRIVSLCGQRAALREGRVA